MTYHTIHVDSHYVRCSHCQYNHFLPRLHDKIVRVRYLACLNPSDSVYEVDMHCAICNTEFGLRVKAYYGANELSASVYDFRRAVVQAELDQARTALNARSAGLTSKESPPPMRNFVQSCIPDPQLNEEFTKLKENLITPKLIDEITQALASGEFDSYFRSGSYKQYCDNKSKEEPNMHSDSIPSHIPSYIQNLVAERQRTQAQNAAKEGVEVLMNKLEGIGEEAIYFTYPDGTVTVAFRGSRVVDGNTWNLASGLESNHWTEAKFIEHLYMADVKPEDIHAVWE